MVTKKAVAIGGGTAVGIAALVITLLSIYSPTQLGNMDFNHTYFCQDENKLLQCNWSISGGLGTRCYLDEIKSSWDYCSTGWVKISDYVELQNITNSTDLIQTPVFDENIFNGIKFYCKIVNENKLIQRCVDENTNQTYLFVING